VRLLLVVLLLVACSRREPARSDVMDSSSLGALAFPLTEGTPAARAHFTRGLLALHSFWYDEAQREFTAAIAADPKMDMAYWGLAMSHCKLLWGEDDVEAAKQALARMPDPEKLSEREQEWVMATIELLKADDVPTSRKQFAKAMQGLYDRHRGDEEATFLSIALLSATRPGDLDHLAKRSKSAELAAAVYAKNPKHPGAAHYYIHAQDTPERAAEALPHARAYAAIAPEAFHARHMPAHIFGRLGMWQDAIASCESAWDASLAAAKRVKLSANSHDFHSLAWLVEMPFELGQKSKADAALKKFADAVTAGLGHQHRALYASEVASYMMRTGQWARVDELLAPLAAKAVEDAPPPATRTGSAPSHCAPGTSPPALLEELAVLDARARAAAARHDLATTTQLVAELDRVREALRPTLTTSQTPAAVERIDAANQRSRTSLLARAANDDAALLEALRAQVADADLELSGESNPSGFSVREEIGDVLLRLGRPAEAAAEYEKNLERHPQRARSLLGAARARANAGDSTAAARWYRALVTLWRAADPATDGLAEARAKAAP
jgi:tetratricopeptide (TPR) repeat protein